MAESAPDSPPDAPPAAAVEAPQQSNRKNGERFRKAVARHIAKAYAGRLRVFEEVPLGSSIIGKARRVDILVLSQDYRTAAALETKFQDSQGTADEKMPYALQDCAAMHIPASVVYAGEGWSKGVRHLLAGSAYAVEVSVMGADVIADSRELDVFLAEVFGFWEMVVAGRSELVP